MTRQGNTAQAAPEAEEREARKEPKLTRAAFQISLWLIILGLLVQLLMAIVVYPSLSQGIPASWAGSSVPYNTMSSWLVFIIFPGAEIVLLLLAIFSPKDGRGNRIMESGKAVSLILLALLFTALQYSAFYIPRQ